jgi:hypothetical protein
MRNHPCQTTHTAVLAKQMFIHFGMKGVPGQGRFPTDEQDRLGSHRAMTADGALAEIDIRFTANFAAMAAAVAKIFIVRFPIRALD